ncbi:hypothetical protein ACQPUY_15630 [Clostridium nigeriense]|uniref:hypothetical protein n=1 Tax=Clostridium nigeriense TaxID=1805470 RepID=UPI003D3461EE
MKNKLISIILVYALSLGLIGCGNNLVDKSIENAKVSMENKEYDKALISLELALDEDPENGQANKLYRILEKYIESKELVDNDKFHEAEEIISKLDNSLFTGLSIEEDINSLKEKIDKHNKEEVAISEEKKKQEEESSKTQEENKEEVQIQESNVEQQSVAEEKKDICFICKQEDYISNLQELHGFGVVHNYCYESAPICSICHQTKLIGNEDLDKNGICDYKCDKLCTNCWTKPKNSEVSGLCNECEWNKYYSNKATCGGCTGNIVDGSLAGTICPDCGTKFKIIPVN